jgi:hypothetical protein
MPQVPGASACATRSTYTCDPGLLTFTETIVILIFLFIFGVATIVLVRSFVEWAGVCDLQVARRALSLV